MTEHTDTGYCFCDSCRPSRSYMTSFPQGASACTCPTAWWGIYPPEPCFHCRFVQPYMGWTWTGSEIPPRLSDEDVKRIAEAIAKELKESKNG